MKHNIFMILPSIRGQFNFFLKLINRRGNSFKNALGFQDIHKIYWHYPASLHLFRNHQKLLCLSGTWLIMVKALNEQRAKMNRNTKAILTCFPRFQLVAICFSSSSHLGLYGCAFHVFLRLMDEDMSGPVDQRDEMIRLPFQLYVSCDNIH